MAGVMTLPILVFIASSREAEQVLVRNPGSSAHPLGDPRARHLAFLSLSLLICEVVIISVPASVGCPTIEGIEACKVLRWVSGTFKPCVAVRHQQLLRCGINEPRGAQVIREVTKLPIPFFRSKSS